MGAKPLESKAQMLIMWKALAQYVEEMLQAGKNVNIKNFGAFAYQIKTELPKIAQRSINPYDKISVQRTERKHVHHLSPQFIVDPKIQSQLTHYAGKDDLDAPRSQTSIYQKGFRMVYCNPYPIAAACMISTDVVKDGLNAFWSAIVDLVNYGRDIDLNFGFCRIQIVDRDLRVRFRKDFRSRVDNKDFEERLKMSNTSCSSFWKTSYDKTWKQSTLGNLVGKPQNHLADAIALKTKALKLMSIDMSSTGVIRAPSNTHSRLRARSRPVMRSRGLY